MTTTKQAPSTAVRGSLIVPAVLAVVPAALTYRFLLGHRSDYLGHFLAGAGGTLLLLSIVLGITRKPRGWIHVFVVALAIGIGWISEATIYRVAIFDPVDFVNQSLGAALAGAATIGRGGSILRAAGTAVLGLGLLLLGFFFAFA